MLKQIENCQFYVYLTIDMFDTVPISISFVSKIEVIFSTGSVKWNCAINEKYRAIYIVFVADLREN